MESAYFITVSEGHLLKRRVFFICVGYSSKYPLKGMINETECDTQSGSVLIMALTFYVYIYIYIYIYIYKLFIRGTFVVEKLS